MVAANAEISSQPSFAQESDFVHHVSLVDDLKQPLLHSEATLQPPPVRSIESDIEVWEYDPSEENEQLPHKYEPNRPIPLHHLHGLGVLTFKLDADNWENDPELEKIKAERGYRYGEVITVSREAMPDFDKKVKGFFQEHMHSQEEIRLILDGYGYWDIRDYDEKWIRFRVSKGDLIVLPPGMYHRFTLNKDDYIKALLLYTEVPERTQHGRCDDSEARKNYIDNFLSKNVARIELHTEEQDLQQMEHIILE